MRVGAPVEEKKNDAGKSEQRCTLQLQCARVVMQERVGRECLRVIRAYHVERKKKKKFGAAAELFFLFLFRSADEEKENVSKKFLEDSAPRGAI